MSNNHRQILQNSALPNYNHGYQMTPPQPTLRPFANRIHLLGIYLLAICLSLSACKDNKPTPNQSQTKSKEVKIDAPKKKTDKKVILFYGDSLTAGYGLEENESFPSLIEDKIDSLGMNYTVVNAGLSGETTSGGLQRIDWVMKQKVDIFFLELGANDMLRGLPLVETRKNLSKIIATVKAKNPHVKIALCEMISPPNMGQKYGTEFTSIFKDLTSPPDITFIPFFLDGVAGHPDLLLKDGKHPNAAGQLIVADNIWKSLEKLL